MLSISTIIDRIIEVEGSEYTNLPSDSGGPTKYGITQRVLAAYRKAPVAADDVRNLTEKEARDIYKHMYVYSPGFQDVFLQNHAIGYEVIDTGVNIGVVRSTQFLQRALNALNRRERDYADIDVDGQCGPTTVSALRRFLAIRPDGERVLLAALNILQGAYYISLAERRPKDEEFLYGWLKNRVII